MKTKRQIRGQTLLEFPAAVWLSLITFAFPLMSIGGFSYRASLLYFSVRSVCSKAAKASSFTQAIQTAETLWAANTGAWSGTMGSEKISVIAYPSSTASGNGNTIHVFTSPAAVQAFMSNPNYSSSDYTFLMRLEAQTTLDPLLPVGSTWMGLSIPGLNAPYNLNSNYESFIENSPGMKN